MYVYMYMCEHVCMCMHIHVCVYIYIYVCISMHVHYPGKIGYLRTLEFVVAASLTFQSNVLVPRVIFWVPVYKQAKLRTKNVFYFPSECTEEFIYQDLKKLLCLCLSLHYKKTPVPNWNWN